MAERRRSSLVVFVPLAVFAALVAVFVLQLTSGRDVSELPSALIGQPAPALAMPALEGIDRPGLEAGSLALGKPTIVNIWASWCAPCRAEHPVLLELGKREDVQLVGINYKDKPENARRFLNSLGNPFDAVGVDETGRAAIEWGFYGVPETFLVDGTGNVVHKIVGPITAERYETLLGQLESLSAKGG